MKKKNKFLILFLVIIFLILMLPVEEPCEYKMHGAKAIDGVEAPCILVSRRDNLWKILLFNLTGIYY